MKSRLEIIKITLVTLVLVLIVANVIAGLVFMQSVKAAQSGVHRGPGISAVVLDASDNFFCIIDSESKRIVSYELMGVNEVVLRGVRYYKHDLVVKDSGRDFANGATVRDAKRVYEKQQEREARDERRKEARDGIR